ncbi:hypothetical protein ABNF65_24795, partial [Paenibacillus larvae]
MITDKERFELEYLLNKEARKYNQLFKSKPYTYNAPNWFNYQWIDYQCFDDLGHALRPIFLIVICKKNRCILRDRSTDKEEHINRYFPLI